MNFTCSAGVGQPVAPPLQGCTVPGEGEPRPPQRPPSQRGPHPEATPGPRDAVPAGPGGEAPPYALRLRPEAPVPPGVGTRARATAWRIWSQGAAETREASQPASKHPFSGPGLSPLKLPAPNNSRGCPATLGQELCFEGFRDLLKSGFNGCNWLWNAFFLILQIFFGEHPKLGWGAVSPLVVTSNFPASQELQASPQKNDDDDDENDEWNDVEGKGVTFPALPHFPEVFSFSSSKYSPQF